MPINTDNVIIIILLVGIGYLVMNYCNSNSNSNVQYKYIPVYKDDKKDNSNDTNSENSNISSYGHYNNGLSRGIPRRPIGGPLGSPVGGPVGGPIGGPVGGPVGGPIDPLRKFDYDAIYDEFTPPFRRSYYDDYSSYRLHPSLYPAYTRGPLGRFRKIGTLIAEGVSSNDKYKFLNMNGREKYPGRDYEYYATSTNAKDKIKFYIETKGKEIHDGDIVKIPELDGYKFQYKEDPDLSPKYDPYLV
jgi:hypothetical protein